jgi:hypothetical protein
MDDRKETARYVAEFGNQGANWYAQGLTFEQAREKHVRELNEYTERQRALTAKNEKLLAERKAGKGG